MPWEDSSGERRFRGSITKNGIPRVRHILIEASWRLPMFQPDYKAYKQRRAALEAAKAKGNKSARKKLLVGLVQCWLAFVAASPPK